MESSPTSTNSGAESTWAAVDAYVENVLHEDDVVLDRALEACVAAGLPEIQVSAPLGKLLGLLARICRARRVLEVGTLGGYSTIWLARSLPEDGEVTTIEIDPLHARVAGENFAQAGLAERIDLRVGNALEILPVLEPSYDLVFIDADKTQNVSYLEAALKLSHAGTVIVLDNVVREGAIADPSNDDPRVEGSRAGLRWLGEHPRIDATALQTVGAKGYDGFAIGVVEGVG
jgi:predicted O-methyltransferase YrrM